MNIKYMNKKNYKNVYQFKVTLKNINPPVWRRIQVPENYSFWDLHVAIQDSMGWADTHLHEFTTIVKNHAQIKRIGLPDFEMMESDVLFGWEENISDYFSLGKNKAMNYTYDFGDNWDHRVELEKIIQKEYKINYPICVKGKRACPPEDCGGIWGYEDKLKIIKNPKHPEYDEIAEWMGEDFDSENFDCAEIVFDNPLKRLKDSGILEHVVETPKKSKKHTKETEVKMDWEIDYSELPYDLKDENGNKIKPFILMIVHPESYFVVGSYLASPNNNYLQEFLDKILNIIKDGSFLPGRILVKKKELFNLLLSPLKKMNIELEMVKRTKTVESVKKEMGKF